MLDSRLTGAGLKVRSISRNFLSLKGLFRSRQSEGQRRGCFGSNLACTCILIKRLERQRGCQLDAGSAVIDDPRLSRQREHVPSTVLLLGFPKNILYYTILDYTVLYYNIL